MFSIGAAVVAFFSLGASGLALAQSSPSSTQAWPNRPIRVIVSQAAGGAPDIICRIVTDRLSQALGQQIVVENRPGGGNIVGAQAAARAAPDGYTIFFATAAALVSNPYTYKSLPYDPAKDFAPVAMIAQGPFVVLAHPSVPVKNLSDVAAYDKANPGKLTVATDGPRNFSGILAAWLNKLAGTNVLSVPYATMPQGVQDTLAGRVQLTILALPIARPHIAGGALRPLAISSQKRLAAYPELPSIAEDYPGVDFTGWFAFVAPTGTPQPVIDNLNAEVDAILKTPEIAKRLAELGFFTEGADTPQGAAKSVQAQYELWGKLVREIGLQPE